MNIGSPVVRAVITTREGRSTATGGAPARAALAAMPTAVAALATVPFSPTWRVAACSTRPMQQACRDSPLKSASELKATPMPSRVSRASMLTWFLRFTLGSEMSRLSAKPDVPPPSLVASVPSCAAVGIAQPLAPADGSRAIMDSRPLPYGSQTAVQPSAVAPTYGPPFMNCALTWRPAAGVEGPDSVSPARNGGAQGPFRH